MPKSAQETPKMRPKGTQECPTGAPEASNSLPPPSQIEPKTFPNPIFMSVFSFYFPIPNLHLFVIDLLLICCIFSGSRNLKKHAPVEAKR